MHRTEGRRTPNMQPTTNLLWLITTVSFTVVNCQTSCSNEWIPENACGSYKCKIQYTYNKATDTIDFTLQANANESTWLGVGFSSDKEMPNSDIVMGALPANGQLKLEDRWASSKATPTVDGKDDLTQKSGQRENGILTLKFTRKRNTSDVNDDMAFSDTTCYYFLFAVGPITTDFRFQRHSKRFVSQNQICIKSTCQLELNCRSKMNAVFVLDGSESVGKINFVIMISAVNDFANNVLTPANTSQLGVVLFGDAVQATVPLTANLATFLAGTSTLVYKEDGTGTHLGIKKGREMLLENNRTDIPNIMIVITDGVSFSPPATIQEANITKNAGILVYSIGIISNLLSFVKEDYVKEIRAIALNDSFVKELGKYKELILETQIIAGAVCSTVRITVHLKDTSVYAGETIVLSASVNFLNINGSWSKDGKEIVNGGRYGIVSGETQHTLTITNSVLNDTGEYTFYVSGAQSAGRVTVIVNGAWSEWRQQPTECNQTCGGGRRRINEVKVCDNPAPQNGGSECPGGVPFREGPLELCNPDPCKIHGGWSEWRQQATPCSASCGGGRRRINEIKVCDNPAPANGGADCPKPVPFRQGPFEDCNTQLCAVNGGWSEWRQQTTPCSQTCGGGTRRINQIKVCDNPAPANGGAPCPGPTPFQEGQPQACNTQPCPVNGGWSEWRQQTTPCSQTCGGGTRRINQIKVCDNPAPANGGAPCPGPTPFQEGQPLACNTQPCPVDGGWSEWRQVPTDCTVTCGGGIKRINEIKVCDNPAPAHGGANCSGPTPFREGTPLVCNSQSCKVDGGWSEWTRKPSECTATCGGGRRKANEVKLCNNPAPANGGANCPGDTPFREGPIEKCNIHPCDDTGCGTKDMDIVLLVDTGASSVSTFSAVRNNIRAFLQGLIADGGDTRVAIVPYASVAVAPSALSITSDLGALANAVNSIIPSTVFTTRQSVAFEYLANTLALFRPEASKLAIVISPTVAAADDRNRIIAASATVKQRGVQIYFQGNGSNHDLLLWQEVTAWISTRSVFLGPLTRLDKRLREITTLYCDVCGDCVYSRNGEGFTAYPPACDQFYHCVIKNGTIFPYLKTCASGTFWNNRIRRCDHIRVVSKDPTTSCRYTCTSADSTNKYPSALSCSTYYQCKAGALEYRCCENGHSFNPLTKECVADPTCKSDCLDNTCKNSWSTATYQSRLGCSSYYQCDGFKRAYKCCTSGQRFDAAAGQCVNDASCTDSCSAKNCPLKAVANNECVFEALYRGKYVTKTCPDGTAFVLRDCQCSKYSDACSQEKQPPKTNLCLNEVVIKFSETTLLRSGMYIIWPLNVKVGQFNSKSVGLFNGETLIKLPHLRDNDFRLKRVIRIRYTEDSSSNGEQVLFGNPCCSPSKLPSLVITHTANTRTVRIGARTSGKQMVYTQIQYGGQYDQTFWKEIVVGYNGFKITGQLRIYDTNISNRVAEYTLDPLDVGGPMAAVESGMSLGLGVEAENTGYSAFRGAVQEMGVYRCKYLAINLSDY